MAEHVFVARELRRARDLDASVAELGETGMDSPDQPVPSPQGIS